MTRQQHILNRRSFLAGAAGLGWAAHASHNGFASSLATSPAILPLAPRPGHHPATAKRAIMFFLTGGASHVDSFDPKPELATAPANFLKSPWAIKPRGQSGLLATDLFPATADHMDDLCLIRSMHADHNCHYQATLGMHTGSVTVPRPSIGSWISYGLGSENANLPSHVVIADEAPYAGSLVWDANFLPAYHQGVRITPGSTPIPNLAIPNSGAPLQNMELSLIERFNTDFSKPRHSDTTLKAQMLAFKTAFGLEHAAPEIFDFRGESPAVLQSYGVKAGDNRSFGWQCLVARRLAERGVRFIELFDIGSHNNWDAHGDIQTHGPLATKMDKPLAALISDLKLRGMFDDTLIIFCTEFGRTPTVEGGKGRSHHNRAFTCWLAGGGVKSGYAYGKTDKYGMDIAEKPVHVNDFHATILHLMGLDHEQLTYFHNGRDFRLTDVGGHVIRDVIA